jgi:uncharacterized protein YdeI (YjbR/CyaY-like superfamily)
MQENTIWSEELRQIAEIIGKAPLVKEIKWGAEVFTWNGKNVVSYGGFKNHFAIWFYNGVFLSDKYNVLVAASDGKTKSLRQWRFTSASDIDEVKIAEYLLEAIEIEKQGLKIAPEKSAEFTLSPFLAEAFSNDPDFKSAFEKLTPGRQKEYSKYVDEPKQEATKKARIEKILPQILEGKGLYDKYKN